MIEGPQGRYPFWGGQPERDGWLWEFLTYAAGDPLLSAWEERFVHDLRSLHTAGKFVLSPKQEAKCGEILRKLRAGPPPEPELDEYGVPMDAEEVW